MLPEICRNKQFVFIIGAPRSGSTWLQHILASHPEIVSTNRELTVFGNYINYLVENYEIEAQAKKEGKWEVGLPTLWNREEFDTRIAWLLNDIYSSLPILPQHKIILDKRPEYSFHVDLIHYYLPTAKFINIMRDGREMAFSWHRTSREAGFGSSSFAGACYDWINYKNAAQQAQKYGNEKYLELHYEHLISNTTQEIEKLLNFCNLSSSSELIKNIAVKNTGEKSLVSKPNRKISYQEREKGSTWQINLSRNELFLAKNILGKELIKEKYEKDTHWGNSNFIDFTYKIAARLRHYINKLK